MNPLDYIYLGFFGVMLYCAILWLIVLLDNRKNVFKDPEPEERPSITFLVPCYNEEEHLGKCLSHLVKLNYPREKLSVIVADDGSSDNSLKIARKYERQHPEVVRTLQTEHSGKANTLNEALKHVNTKLVATMDGDSYPEPDYLKKMIGYFEKKENLAGVTPAVKISNPKTVMQKLQWAEYVFQIYLRKMFSLFNVQYCFPGPGSIYKTNIIKELGGFDENNLTEDMEFAFRVRDKGYQIENSINAYVSTVGPPSFLGLLKQRVRWYRGYMDNVQKYSHMILNPDYGNLGMFLIPVNFIWILIAIFFLFAPLYQNLKNALRTIKNLQLTGLNLPDLANFFSLDPFEYGMLSISVYQVFYLIFFLLGVLTILVALKSADEKIELKKKKTAYFSYFFIYPIIFPLWWLVAVVLKLISLKEENEAFIK